MTQTDTDKLKQHYQWWGLTCRGMRPYLTQDEWDLLYQFSRKLVTRVGSKDLGFDCEHKTPHSRTDCWEALK